MTKGDATRKRILDIAEESVLTKGFGATSIEEIIAGAAITKERVLLSFQRQRPNSPRRCCIATWRPTSGSTTTCSAARAS